MNLVRKLGYAKAMAELITEYSNFQNDVFIRKYNNLTLISLVIGSTERNGLCVSGMQHT